jgi:CheY-like chemotaxis protein
VRRVLLIDDDSQARNAVALALRAKGFDVVAVESGHAGLRAFQTESFDVVIADVFMPGMDGVKLIKALREHKPDFPVIAISGVLLRGTGRTALDLFPMSPELANVFCLQKPFRPHDLLHAISCATGTYIPAPAA